MTDVLQYDLSLAQHEVYFDQIKSLNSPLYNVGGFISFDAVSTERLASAHRVMVEREEIFGLRVSAEGAAINQYFVQPFYRSSEIEIVDFTSSENTDAADSWALSKFSEPFEVHDSQLFKAFILILPKRKVRYLVLAHHLMMDGWGFANWSAKINDYYNDSGHQAQYNGRWVNVLEEDRKYKASKRFESDKAYWSNHQALRNEPYMQEFYPVAEDGISKSIRLSTTLPLTLVRQVDTLKSGDISAGQFYLGALATYLGTMYELSQLNIGLPLHNRRSHIHKQMLGMFTTISPLAVHFDSNCKFSDLIQQINKNQKSDWRHQRLPISHMSRSTESGRLFDISYSYLNLEGNLNFEGQPAEINYVAHNHEATPAMLTVWQDGNSDETVLHLDVNLAFFTAKEGESFLSRYVRLLSKLSSNPNMNLNDISMIDDDEVRHLQSNFKPSLSRRYATVVDYFVAQASVTPNAIALCWSDEEWTYEKLDKRASEIANFLSSEGVELQSYVGVFMDRTPQLIASLLAIWKLGAIYVPLDTSYPVDRIGLIIADCDVDLILVDSNNPFPIQEGVCCVQLNDVTGVSSFYRKEFDADNISHLIYTSGSTGKPKGVMVRHRNVASLIEWADKYFSTNEISHTLASTSINFDLSVFEFFVPLSLGHTVYLVDSALTLLEFNKALPITLINTVPSAISVLLKNNAIPNSIITFNIAGEPLTKELVNQIFEQFPSAVINNLYGPSEDTTYSTVKRFNKPVKYKPSIGNSIAGTKSFVVSSKGKLLPKGIPGELYLTGDGVTKGYLKRPELTAEKFVRTCFLDRALAYKTGDIVKLMDNGELEYLGRKDEQIKFSGHRIELDEVDCSLVQLPFVDEAKTIVCEEKGTPKLTSFVTLNCSKSLTSANDILCNLQQILPSYMIPAELNIIENIPLLPNGKVDKLRLEKERGEAITNTITSCKGVTEFKLADIWQKVLSCDMEIIGANISFFELGGRSLQYASLLSEVNEEFSVQLSFTELFTSQSLRHLASIVDGKERIGGTEVVPLSHDDPVRVSKAQEQIWLQQKIHGDSYQYNMPVALLAKENVDVPRINKIIDLLVKRHSVLRSVHVEEQGEIKQVVLSEVNTNITVYDFTACTELDIEFQQQLCKDISKPFILDTDILLRVSLYRLSEKQNILVFVLHHLIVDGVAIQLLMNDFNCCYNELTTGQASTAQASSIQFRDFCVWQRSQPDRTLYESGIEYFKTLLDKAPMAHGLPVENVGHIGNGSGRVVSNLTNNEIQNIEQLSVKLAVSEFDVVHTLLALLYARISQVNDIVIGTPVANRLTPVSQKMVGCFVNMLPLRTEIDITCTFSELVQSVSNRTRQALNYQNVYFSELVERLQLNKVDGLSPLFQLMISFDEYQRENTIEDSTQWQHLDLDWATALFDIELRILKTSEQWKFEWVFDQSKFSNEFIERLQRNMVILISQLLEKTDSPVSDFYLIEDSAFKQIKRNLANTTESETGSLIDSIEHIFQLYPEQLAVQTAEGDLTYRQLQIASQQLISELFVKGIKVGDRVGVLLNRGKWLIPSILATLKAGVTFIPLDPSYPKARLQFMMADSEMACVITDEELSNQFQLGNLALTIESIEQRQERLSFESPKLTSTAYIIYTSGSTGQPKGVVISRSALSSHIRSVSSVLKLGTNDNILQIASFSFDTFLEQTLAGLCAGASLFITDRSKLDSVEFFELISSRKITTIDLPVAYLTLWLEDKNIKNWNQSDLRQIYVGGEALPSETVKNWFKYGKHQNCSLFNAYGPTEAVITSTIRKITLNDTLKVSIGEVIGRRSLLVLNEHQHWCEPSVVGELYIGGVIADGYINQPELTKEHFVSIAGEVDQTYYRTGDKVWYDADGVLYFAGRTDDQIQLHGIRVELAGVENTLSQYRGIQSLKVSLKSDISSSLIAYIIKSTEDFDEALFFQFARSVLPSHCVPRYCVLVENWPLTPNGKICIESLPSPQLKKSSVVQSPKTEVAIQLQGMWAELLNTESSNIGAKDNFFELGGNSLSLLKLSANAYDKWGVKFDISQLFSNPTIEALANEIENRSSQVSEIIEIKPSIAEQVLVSSQQNRIWLQHQLAGEKSYAFNMIKAISIKGLADVNVIKSALNTLWQRHSVLRSRFSNDGNKVLVSQHHNRSIPIELLEISSREELDYTLNEFAKHNFDLTNESLIYCKLCRLDQMDWVVVINMHHIVSDGWSIQIFEREFTKLCRALVESKTIELPSLPIQYSDYAAFQSQSTVINETQLAFWKQYLADSPTCHDIILDYERPQQPSGRGRNVEYLFSRALSSNINKYCIEKMVTPFVLLQSAFSLFIAKESGIEDVVIGTPVANRISTQTENLMGCFMNMIALRTNFKLEDSFTSILQHQKSMIYQAFENQSVPFEIVVEALNPTRITQFSPLFQIAFVYHEQSQVSINIPGVVLDEIEIEECGSKYDVTLNIELFEDGFHCKWEYDTAIFSTQRVELFAANFETFVCNLLCHPEQPIKAILLLTPTEQQSVLRTGFGEELELPAVLGVDQLIDEMTVRYNRNIAIVEPGRELTYEQLHEQSNQLAHAMNELGVEPGQKIGVRMEPSVNLVVSILGIMKARAIYVPLGVEAAVGRVNKIVNHAGLKFVIGGQTAECSVPCYSISKLSLKRFPTTSVKLGMRSLNDCAYILYTSGSTGMPKGVQISHGAFLNFICSMAKNPGMESNDRLLAMTSPTFDISGLELFLPLVTGAQLVCDNVDIKMDGRALGNLLEKHDITVFQSTPIVWRILLESGWGGNAQLKALCGGEALPKDLAMKLSNKVAQLWNMYGPTETTVWSSCSMVSAERNKAVEVDIGHPIHNTQIFVLDPDLNPVPNGSKGQIFIGGRGLAIGYLDLPAENNSAFVTENDLPPSQKNIGINRLYATGDLGRFDLSGNLQHLGRKDHQIKLRGFRIEPGEVESAINEIDLVEDSLVVLNENKLLAYCAADEKTINADDIRRKLIEELPQYMIPQLIVILPVFPVTPSGKKDRKRLPSPVEIKQETRKQANPIDNQTQEQISTLLSEIMSKPNLDLNASFFDLGANSMDIVNLAGRLSALRNQDISPIDAFQYPTICLLGEFIESKGVVLQSESRKQNLSEAKQRLKKRRKKEVNHDKADIS